MPSSENVFVFEAKKEVRVDLVTQKTLQRTSSHFVLFAQIFLRTIKKKNFFLNCKFKIFKIFGKKNFLRKTHRDHLFSSFLVMKGKKKKNITHKKKKKKKKKLY